MVALKTQQNLDKIETISSYEQATITALANTVINNFFLSFTLPRGLYIDEDLLIKAKSSTVCLPFLNNSRYKKPDEKLFKVYRQVLAEECVAAYTAFIKTTPPSLLCNLCLDAVDQAFADALKPSQSNKY